MTESITLGRVAELEAAGFRLSVTMHHENGKSWRTWSYQVGAGPDAWRSAGYPSPHAAWAAADADARVPGRQRPRPLPTVALDVIWPETLALLRWNLSSFLTTARGDWPADPDGGLAEVETAIASIDAAASISHGFGAWDDAACAWTGANLSARSVTASPPVVAWWNAARGPDSYLDRFPEAARPFCDRAYNDGATDGASYGETLADAIRAALENHNGANPTLAATITAVRAALEAYEATDDGVAS